MKLGLGSCGAGVSLPLGGRVVAATGWAGKATWRQVCGALPCRPHPVSACGSDHPPRSGRENVDVRHRSSAVNGCGEAAEPRGDLARDRGGRRRRRQPVCRVSAWSPGSARPVFASCAGEGSSCAGSDGTAFPPPWCTRFVPIPRLKPTTGDGAQCAAGPGGLPLPRQPRDRPRRTSGSWAQDAFPLRRDGRSVRQVSGMSGRMRLIRPGR